MHWGIRRYQPYSSNPRKGGKTGKFIGQKSRIQKDNKGSAVALGVGLAAAGVLGVKAMKAAAHNKQSKKVAKKGAEKAAAEERERKWNEYKEKVKNRRWDDYTEEERPYILSKEEKTKLKNMAKKGDYNMDYLEAIQNDWFLSDDHPNAKSTRQSEYNKFLDNPHRYMSTHETVEVPPKADSKSGLMTPGSSEYKDWVKRRSGDQYNSIVDRALNKANDFQRSKNRETAQAMRNRLTSDSKGSLADTSLRARMSLAQIKADNQRHSGLMKPDSDSYTRWKEDRDGTTAKRTAEAERIADRLINLYSGQKKKKNYRFR